MPKIHMLLCYAWVCVPQIEREARYSHYVSKLLWYNRSKLDSSFRQRVARMAGAQLAQQQANVAAGGRRL
jgi:hypothetical protein